MTSRSIHELNVFLINVRSLIDEKRRRNLSDFVAKNSIDILFLTETWLTEDFTDAELYLNGYTLHRSDRPPTKSGSSSHGGVLIAVNDKFTFTPLVSFTGCIASGTVSDGNVSIFVAAVYNPPRGSAYRLKPTEAKALYEEVISRNITNYNAHIIAGDFNLPTVEWSTCHSCEPLESVMTDLFAEDFEQIIDFPTRGSNILDLVFLRGDIVVLNKQKFHVRQLKTDHSAVAVSLSLDKPITGVFPEKNKLCYSFCKADYASILQSMADEPFRPVCWSNPNVLVEEWEKWISGLVQKFVPRRTKHRSSLPPWVTPGTSHLIKKLATKRKLLPEGNQKLLQLIAHVDNALQLDRSDYEERLSNRRSQNLFRHFRSLKSSQFPSTMYYGELKACDDAQKAELFAQYFSSVFSLSSDWNPSSIEINSPDKTISSFDCSEERIQSILKNLDVSKSSGIDAIPGCFLKATSSAVSHSLHQIFTKIQQTATFPESWKMAVVIPVWKKDDKRAVKNHRPVSLLPIASKAFERCIFMDLYEHCSTMLSNAQYGFRRRRSAVLQLLVYMEHLFKAVKQGTEFEVVYTDFEKAFDKVDHGVILCKLWHIGVRGKLWMTIKSYLQNRRQVVKVGDSISKIVYMTSGVPQGSLLGPLLFLILINDLPDVCVSSDCLACADDAKIIRCSDLGLFQIDLENFSEWCLRNFIPFNADKCKLLSSAITPSVISISNFPVEAVASYKDLGLLINPSLTWDEHIQHKCSKAIKVFFMIKRNSANISMTGKVNLYKTMILPIITYASQCWYATTTSLRKLEALQKRVVKWITFDHDHRRGLISANLLPLSLYLQLLDLMMLSKIINGRCDIDYSRFLTITNQPNSIYPTRLGLQTRFVIEKPRTRKEDQCFWYRAPAAANRIATAVDFFNEVNLKSRIIEYLWHHFLNKYQECDSDSWRV